MIKSFIPIVLALALAIVVGESRPAAACSCMESPPEKMFAFSDAVFRGTPLSYSVIEESGIPVYVYLFQVTACWKGDVDELVELRSFVSEDICGIFIAPGFDALVYAYEQADHLRTNLCSVLPGNSPEHLEWLGQPTCGPVSLDDTSWGSVKALYR